MKTTIHIIAVIACLALVSCSYSPTIVRTAKGGYYASGGASFLARQRIASATLETAEGDKITIQGVDNDSDDIGKAGMNGFTAIGLAKEFYGAENLKVTDAGKTDRAAIGADVKKTEIGADVVNKTNAGNNALELPGTIPETLPR